jgi:hypothetical protein
MQPRRAQGTYASVFATLVGLAIAAWSPALVHAAVPHIQRFDTELTVRHVAVDPDHTLNVSGTVDSKWYCEEGREIRLWMQLDGPDQVVDIDLSSLLGNAWAVRSFGGDADGANAFYIKADRLKLKLERVNGDVDRAICRAARVPVSYAAGT